MGKSVNKNRNHTNESVVRDPQIKRNTLLSPKTEGQKKLLNCIRHSSILTFATGSSGTGKTYVPTMEACRLLSEKTIEKIIITRPMVEAINSRENELSALPGDIFEKTAPWAAPILDTMKSYFGTSFVEYMLEKEIIQIVPLALMRGRSFPNSFIILDEAQNASYEQLYLAITRIGDNSKMVITGDYIMQNDVGSISGLGNMIKFCKDHSMNGVSYVDFGVDDIVRSAFVKQFIVAAETKK